MKKWLHIILLAFLPVLSCVGQKDDPAPEVRLVADLTALNVTAGEQATFTVYSGSEDVTADAVIRNVTDGGILEGNVFAPAQEGEWSFVAEIDGQESEPLTISAIAIAEAGKEFFRRSLVLDFTGTWCVNCPKMEAAIGEAMEARPGRIVPVSVHCMAVDPMYLKPASDDLVKQFGIKAYPSAVVDMDPESVISQSSPELLLSHVDRLLDARGPAAGIRVASTWLEDAPVAHGGVALQIEAELTAVREGNWTLGFAVLEDGIVAAQTGGTTDHVHNNVLRHWSITEKTQSLKEGDTLKLYIIFEAFHGQRVMAMAIRDGIVDNVITCPAGASADYQYEETD